MSRTIGVFPSLDTLSLVPPLGEERVRPGEDLKDSGVESLAVPPSRHGIVSGVEEEIESGRIRGGAGGEKLLLGEDLRSDIRQGPGPHSEVERTAPERGDANVGGRGNPSGSATPCNAPALGHQASRSLGSPDNDVA